jgi:hypothetical protein
MDLCTDNQAPDPQLYRCDKVGGQSAAKRESDTGFSSSGFFMNQFPSGPEYPIGNISNFYDNSQLCFYHRSC